MSLKIISDVYSILGEHETEGCDLYSYDVVSAISSYLKKQHPNIKWLCEVSEWPNEEGGACAFTWVEDGTPRLGMFDFKYSRGV